MKKPKDNSRYVVGAQILALVLLVVFNWILYSVITTRSEQRYAYMRTRKDANQIATAMEAYRAAYGTLPLSDKAEILAADFFAASRASGPAYNALPTNEMDSLVRILNGEDFAGYNSNKTQFLDFTPSEEHSNVMIDAWGTLYQIKYLNQTNFMIQSAGRNGKYGDRDDIYYSSLLSGFVRHR